MTIVHGYIAKVQYSDKAPMLVGNFTVPRERTEQETEAAAMRLIDAHIHDFWLTHFSDETSPPKVLTVTLGSVMFVPSDHTW